MKCISAITVTLIQRMGNDSMICAAAKVSTNGEEAGGLVDEEANYGLLSYLMKHRHGTPFEHGALTIFVHAPIFVWREWHRHRVGFSYNEESARYRTLEPTFYLPESTRPMFKVDDWRAGRPKFSVMDDPHGKGESYQAEAYARLCKNLAASYDAAYTAYENNLSLGVDPGLARDCLPVGIYSSCWVTCNPRSIMHFLSLRTHHPDATQVSYPLFEIEQAANKLEAIFAECWPLTYKAFQACGRVAP